MHPSNIAWDEAEHILPADTAKLIRTALQAAFPGQEFSVRTKTYSMGASVNVYWLDGPTPAEVEKIADQYAGAGFDGAIDLKYQWLSWLLPDGSAIVARDQGTQASGGACGPRENPRPHPDARLVAFGADHVFCSRDLSSEFEVQILAKLAQEHGAPFEMSRDYAPAGYGAALWGSELFHREAAQTSAYQGG